MPSGMPGQVAHGFAGGIAGRRYRHPPTVLGKTATHRASRPSAPEACRFPCPLVQCRSPEPGRTLLSTQFCSFVAPPKYDLQSACMGAIESRPRRRSSSSRLPANGGSSWSTTSASAGACHAAHASGLTSRLASWVSMASARLSSSRLKYNIFCSSRRSNWPANAAAVPYAAIS
jgi:hypothetical protein